MANSVTRQELDRAAPNHPVCFSTGPDASLTSLALKQSGIDRNFRVADGQEGFVERDPASGEPTGIVRNGGRLIKVKEKEKGSLEAGKLADFIVLDKDPLTCPLDGVKDLEVEQTYLGGKCVYRRRPGKNSQRLAAV